MFSVLYLLSPCDFRDEFYETDKKLIIPLITKLFELIKRQAYFTFILKSSMNFSKFIWHGT